MSFETIDEDEIIPNFSGICPDCGNRLYHIHDLKCPLCDNRWVVWCPKCQNHKRLKP